MGRRSISDHIDSVEGFSSRLREARLEAGLSQKQLSFDGCSPAYLSRLERGERFPTLQIVHALARRLDVHPAWLATGEATKTTEELERYREGYGDALSWVLRNLDLEDYDRERIEDILNPERHLLGLA